MTNSKEKQEILVSTLTRIGALAGTNDVGAADGVKGLDMSNEQAKCNDEAKSVRDGLFKIVVMGTFTSGKSTFINALIGSKVLPESVLPSTAILTFVQYGTDESRADVYMVDEKQPDGSVKVGDCITMNVEDFKNEYQYTRDDERTFIRTGSVPRFEKVKYAIIYCSKPLMEGGVTIIDSPGLEDKTVATEIALNIAQKAQAVIYVTLERGFSQPDKDYISSNFRNCPNNVFFVVNKFDLVPAGDRNGIIQKIKDELAPVFTDNGVLNEELLNRRVFGISSLRALDARRGMTYDYEEEKEIELSDSQRKNKFEKSWFAPFESELEKFLTTDERCVAQYQNCFNRMAVTYRNVEKQIFDYVRVYTDEIRLDVQHKEECEKIMADIQSGIDLTRATFDNSSLKIQNAVTSLLSGCAANIDRSWEQDMKELAQKVDVGTLSYMWQGLKQMNPLASKQSKEANMKEFSKKFIDVVTEYFSDRVSSYITDNEAVVGKVVKECQEELNVSISKTDALFCDLAKNLVNGDCISVQNGEKNWLQIMLSAYLGDFSASFKGGLDGKAPWVEYLKKTIFNTVWQAVLMCFVDGGLGVLLAVTIEYFQSKSNKNETVKKILEKSKDSLIRVVREKTEDMTDTLNKKIASEMNKKKEEQCESSIQKLDDERKRMRNIEEFYANHNTNLESEKARFDKILTAIYQEAANAYSIVFGKQLVQEQFKQF